jgi:hypothetical protein
LSGFVRGGDVKKWKKQTTGVHPSTDEIRETEFTEKMLLNPALDFIEITGAQQLPVHFYGSASAFILFGSPWP